MMKMKKVVSTLLVGTMIGASVVGCGSANSETATTAATTASSSTAAQKSVAITLLNSKGEIQEGLETMAKKYEEKTGVSIEIMPCGAGESPFQKISTMYTAGNPPTFAILDTTDVKTLAEEKAIDLTNETWIKEMTGMTTEINGKIYSFPLCIEGRGIIYNKTIIKEKLGKDFDPKTINSYDALNGIFQELETAGMKYPIVISKEDWSLGAHQLQYLYETTTGDNKGTEDIINQLKDGKVNLLENARFNELVQTFDLLKKYNINNPQPLAATYEQDPIFLAEGEAAFWFNGSWAWPNILEAGGEASEYGFIPYVLGNDTADFANNKIQASVSKQVMMDKEKASDEEIQAAKDFLNYLVYDEEGQKGLVEECSLIPAAANNPNSPSDPLGQSIKAAMKADSVFTASAIVPGDHWSVLGSAMQKYLAGESTKEELAKTIETYWIAAK